MLIGITGASGTLGKELINLFKKKYKFSIFNGDIRIQNDLNEWLSNANIDAIIHLASIVPIRKVNKNPKFAREVNYIGAKNLMNFFLNKKINLFIQIIINRYYIFYSCNSWNNKMFVFNDLFLYILR